MQKSSSLAITTPSLLIKDSSITNLWRLEVLGITELKKSRVAMANAGRELFLERVIINEEGRYEARSA